MTSLGSITPILPEISLILLFIFVQKRFVTSSIFEKKNLNISGTREDIQKRLTPLFFSLKGLLHGHFKSW